MDLLECEDKRELVERNEDGKERFDEDRELLDAKPPKPAHCRVYA